ncbi:hypothetical protein C8R46DRAFT_1084702 [Mycena filopes]|nr:hypothetical protein C8R46DRAFT_1084702 [Mycena filopes]
MSSMAFSSSSCTTQTYTLEKYSRAYSPKKASGSSEWQHFTNPVLRLILDSKLPPDGTMEDSSVRLRIIWTMNGGAASGAAQDVVLEDLDLLAFSSLKTDKFDSSPLKGVFRDTTFGLRYLYAPDSTESQKVYRRFQVSFNTASVALQLVEAIRDVCPCKTTEPSAVAAKGTAPHRTKTLAVVPPPAQVAPETLTPASVTPKQQIQRMPTMILDSAPSAGFPSSSPLPLPVSSQPQPQLQPQRSLEAPPASPRGPTPSPYTQPSSSQAGKPPSASLPDSSPPSSTADSVMMPPPPLPMRTPTPTPTLTPSAADAAASTAMNVDSDTDADMVQGSAGEVMAAALREATGLYDLPRAALERLVGDVVREDGFVGLLENVSTMWAMKAVAG